MKHSKHPIFNRDDPWFKRIINVNGIPKKLQVKMTALIVNGVMPESAIAMIDGFLRYVPLTADQVPLCTKARLLQIVILIKNSTTKAQYLSMNGPWFEVLFGNNGIHVDDMTNAAIELGYECLSHAYMMMLLEHDYKDNLIGVNSYTYLYWWYTERRYATVAYTTSTMLKLKGTFQHVRPRNVKHVELAQYYTYLFGFHTKLFVQTAKSINDFVYGDLPQLDQQSVVDTAGVIEDAITTATKDLSISTANIAEVETLIGTSTFLMTDIDNALKELSVSSETGMHKSKVEVRESIAATSLIVNANTGSISALLVAQAQNQTKSFANIGLWMYQAFKDSKNQRNTQNVKLKNSVYDLVPPTEAAATLGGTFGFGMVLGYLITQVQEARSRKREVEKLALAATRVEHYDLEEVKDEEFDINHL